MLDKNFYNLSETNEDLGKSLSKKGAKKSLGTTGTAEKMKLKERAVRNERGRTNVVHQMRDLKHRCVVLVLRSVRVVVL